MTCPYLGLVPLSQDDQPFFAGREKEISVVISSLYASSLTVLYGESGVGKTSLIRAGLLPALEQPEHRVAAILFREWQPPEFDVNLRIAALKSLLATINRLRKQGDPSSTPLDWDAFLETFCQGLNLNDPKINLRSVDDLYALPLDRFIKECCAAFYGRLFFVFDQFEDYIYYHPLKEKGDHFDGELARAINDRNVPASFLISLREDGLGKLNRLRSRVPDLLANVSKLEHLDEGGAIEAINKPLRVFNEREGFKVELAPELVTTLLEQADADRLELDEPLESKSNEIQRSDIGIRYKALALQAVLMRLWKVKVEPTLFEAGKNGETILISRDALTQLAQGKGKREDEVRFVVRTYFDQQLLLLDDNIRENAAEILPHMVRPGSQKKARSVNALANESGIPEERVQATLESLKEKPVELVREITGAGKLLYELQHDAMAFAVQDWCIRQRQIIREKRLQQGFADRQAEQELKFKRRRTRLFWYTLIGTAVVLLVVVMWLSWLKKAQETASAKADYLEGEIAIALNSSGAGEYNPVGGLLLGIDTVASFRESHTPIREKALMSLRLGTLQVGHPPSEAQDKRSLVWRQIPAMVSPDQKYLLAIEPGNQIIIFRYDDPKWKPRSYKLTGTPPFEIACSRFSKDSDRIGLRSSDGLMQLWDFSKVEPELSQSSGNLATDLGFSSQIPPEFTKKLGDSIDYESLVKNWMLEALSTVTRPYHEEDGSRAPKLDVPLMSQKFADASELARQGKDGEARSLLSDELKRLGFEIEESNISKVLAVSFMHRANEAQENADECFRVAQRLVPSLENEIKVQRELVRGNKLRDEKKTEEAADAYRKAKALDPTLNFNPEEEAKRGGPSVPGA